MNIKERVETIYNNTLNAVKYTNEQVRKNGKELLEDVKTNSEPWKALAKETVEEGRKLADAQKSIFSETVETLKGQYKESSDRFKAIFTVENKEN